MVNLLNEQCWRTIRYQGIVATSHILIDAKVITQEIQTSPIKYN